MQHPPPSRIPQNRPAAEGGRHTGGGGQVCSPAPGGYRLHKGGSRRSGLHTAIPREGRLNRHTNANKTSVRSGLTGLVALFGLFRPDPGRLQLLVGMLKLLQWSMHCRYPINIQNRIWSGNPMRCPLAHAASVVLHRFASTGKSYRQIPATATSTPAGNVDARRAESLPRFPPEPYRGHVSGVPSVYALHSDGFSEPCSHSLWQRCSQSQNTAGCGASRGVTARSTL